MATHGSSTMDGEVEVSEDAIIQRQKKERKELIGTLKLVLYVSLSFTIWDFCLYV